MTFFGAPYPIIEHPNGFLRTQRGVNNIKSDLLALLLTVPGERVMLPDFGTPLRNLVFEPGDAQTATNARALIISSIETWEPRIAVETIEATIGEDIDSNNLNRTDDGTNKEHILFIRIEFRELDNLQEVQALTLEVPLSGG